MRSQNRKSKFSIGWLLCVLLLSIGLVGCSSNDVQEINITAKEMMFTPSTITVAQATQVRLTFHNHENVINSLMIDGTSIMIPDVGPQQAKSVEFTADQPGEYTIRTSAPNMEMMTATFIVK